jgi:Flp pilus assembly protein TadG
MVEFAFVAVLLVMLVFGIVVFGLLLSFKQDVTRAAAEGARVGAVAQPPLTEPATAEVDARHVATLAATEQAVDSFDQTCGADGMDCIVTVHNCDDVTATTPSAYWDDGQDDCVTVELVYDYDNFPLILDPPIISATLPDRISSKSVARLNQ